MIKEKYKYTNDFKEYVLLLQRLENAEKYFINYEGDIDTIEKKKAYKELDKILKRLNEIYNNFKLQGIQLKTNIKDYL